MKREKPKMNFDLKLLRLQNCRKPKPAEAAHPTVHDNQKVKSKCYVLVEIKLRPMHTHVGEEDTGQGCHDWQWDRS